MLHIIGMKGTQVMSSYFPIPKKTTAPLGIESWAPKGLLGVREFRGSISGKLLAWGVGFGFTVEGDWA